MEEIIYSRQDLVEFLEWYRKLPKEEIQLSKSHNKKGAELSSELLVNSFILMKLMDK